MFSTFGGITKCVWFFIEYSQEFIIFVNIERFIVGELQPSGYNAECWFKIATKYNVVNSALNCLFLIFKGQLL